MTAPSVTRRATFWPLVCLLVVGLLLGLNANLAKLAINSGWPAVSFLFWSVLGAGGLLLVLAFASGHQPGRRRADLVYYLVSGLVSMTLPNALAYGAVPHVGAGFVSLCMAFPPLFTYLLALALRMEQLRAWRAAGITTGLVGALVLGWSKFTDADAVPVWILAALISPIFLAIGNIYRTRFWPQGASPLALAPGMLLAGALLLLPWIAMRDIAWLALPLQGAGLMLLLVQMVVFAATYALYFVLQKIAGPVYMSQIGSVGAVAGAALAVWALGERASWAMGIAAALILSGVLLVNRR